MENLAIKLFDMPYPKCSLDEVVISPRFSPSGRYELVAEPVY